MQCVVLCAGCVVLCAGCVVLCAGCVVLASCSCAGLWDDGGSGVHHPPDDPAGGLCPRVEREVVSAVLGRGGGKEGVGGADIGG